MSPSRKVRGADYHGHGYDGHDDHSIGFPSIEGALMAISFLTFAVYLVRLVMVRNIFFVTLFSFLEYLRAYVNCNYIFALFGVLMTMESLQLLFRNMSNTMTTTTENGAIFLGKRKRSTDLDEDAARILNNMNSFVSDF